MKRVICLYRVSTVGQVDHDDIPMQKTACREFVAQQGDLVLSVSASSLYMENH